MLKVLLSLINKVLLVHLLLKAILEVFDGFRKHMSQICWQVLTLGEDTRFHYLRELLL